MPIGDWQFWVVTIVAIGALAVLYRLFVPQKKGRRTNLTVSASKHKQPRDKNDNTDCGCG